MKISLKISILLLLSFVIYSCITVEETIPFDYAAQYKLDSIAIDKYIADKNLKNIIITSSGLRYQKIDTIPKSQKPKYGDIISVHYTLTLLNDSVVETSRKSDAILYGKYDTTVLYLPLVTNYGINALVSGFTEGLTYMGKGDHFLFLIPSKLGYGNINSSPITANSVLIYDVSNVNIR
ncbi:MAG: FKBP-type peptidyl-prolyl cis-trans isomerase [Chitinophagaceae bacterium]|nr:FKBP-type peptidyl-prolyl cis-trans isomerase [Chitinophagaceae bacterium]